MTRSLLIRRFSVFHPPRSICASHSVQFRCLACAAAVTGLLLRTPTGRATGNSSRVSRATAPRKNLLAHFRCLTAHSSPLSYLIPSHFLLISSPMSLHLSSLLSGPLSFPAHLISFHLSCHVILPITSLRCHRSSSLTAQLAPCSGWLKPGGTFVFNLGKGEEDGEGPASVSHG